MSKIGSNAFGCWFVGWLVSFCFVLFCFVSGMEDKKNIHA